MVVVVGVVVVVGKGGGAYLGEGTGARPRGFGHLPNLSATLQPVPSVSWSQQALMYAMNCVCFQSYTWPRH